MLCDEFCHFKHADRFFPAENSLKIVVGIDISLVFCVLKTVFLDVGPQLFCDLCSGNRFVPTTSPSTASGCMGFMNAALGFRALFLPVFWRHL